MVKNVLTSWGGHLIFIVSGFVMPRLIDHHAGQAALGVWDFGWSLVSYFELAQIGIGSSVNRNVAKYRAVNDVMGLRQTVSTVTAIQTAAAISILTITALLVAVLPSTFGHRLGAETAAARWVVGLLGSALAVQMAFDGFRGVMTGCHRWDLHNAVTSGFHAVTVAVMIAALSLGGGLRGIAAAYLAGMIASETTRAILAHRICPELQLRWRYASWRQARMLMTFGGKTLTDALSRLLLLQANNIMVASYLGPAALAVYARPAALVRHIETLTNKFAFVLTPTASSLDSSGRREEIRDLFIQSTRYGAFLVTPLVLMLVVVGDLILRVWMGPDYKPGVVLAVLAVGYFIPLTQRPAMQVLMGMNKHGWVAISSLFMSIGGLAFGLVVIGPLGWGLTGAAIAVAVPLTLGKGLFTAYYACRELNVSAGEYCRRSFAAPLACAVPFALAMLAGRYLVTYGPVASLLAALACGGAVVTPLYWRFVLPATVKAKLRRRLGLTPRTTGPIATRLEADV